MKTHSREANSIEELDENNVDESKIDYARSFYAPYHPHARKLFYDVKKKFNINQRKICGILCTSYIRFHAKSHLINILAKQSVN